MLFCSSLNLLILIFLLLVKLGSSAATLVSKLSNFSWFQEKESSTVAYRTAPFRMLLGYGDPHDDKDMDLNQDVHLGLLVEVCCCLLNFSHHLTFYSCVILPHISYLLQDSSCLLFHLCLNFLKAARQRRSCGHFP